MVVRPEDPGPHWCGLHTEQRAPSVRKTNLPNVSHRAELCSVCRRFAMRYERGCGSWYALYTRHQHEKTVARNLTGKGFEVFLPVYTAARSWKDRVKLLEMPLFSCYVFLHGTIERRLDILATPGIHDFVSSAGQPAIVATEEIEGIRQAVAGGAKLEPYPFLKTGDWVRVKCGPFAGLKGILIRKKSVYKLVLSIEMLGKAAAVELDAVFVERLSETATETRGILANAAF